MPDPPRWEIAEGPESVDPEGADATIWRWRLRQLKSNIATPVFVKVSGTAMATAPEHLPEATRRAREDCGHSEVEAVLHWWQPPRLIELHTQSAEGNPVGGSGEPPPEGHVEYERRIRAIEDWFRERGIGLWFDRTPEGAWVALVVSQANRVGVAMVGMGPSQLEAAQNAQDAYEKSQTERQDVTIEAPAAVLRAEGVPPTIVVSPGGVPSEEAFGVPTIESSPEVEEERRQLERVAADFGWHIAFAQEPDGAWFWLVRDDVTGEPIKGGQADTWEDALLAVIEKLQPPSGDP